MITLRMNFKWLIFMGVFIFSVVGVLYYLSPKEIIFSYDFKRGLSGWETQHTSNIPDDWSVDEGYDVENNEYFLNIERSNSFKDGGVLGFSRSVSIDVSELSEVYIKTNVRVFSHSLEGSGFFDDSIPEGLGEYPVSIWLTYTDILGVEGKRFLWGFLTKENINLKTNYDLVDLGEWNTFVSGNLKEISPEIGIITNILLVGRGWDFHGNVGGKFEILKSKPSRETYKFKPSVPALDLPPKIGPSLRIKDVYLSIVLAESYKDKESGLSVFDNLADGHGMLFVYDALGDHSIWMKDMKFPIDVIWFDDSFRVVDIALDVSPESFPSVFSPSKPAQYVLEVNAGFIKKHMISIGDSALFIR